MRLWSLHPRYLDSRGLVALWREALLAQKVLSGTTHGYRHHPQLERFKAAPRPKAAIASYLSAIYEEATVRGLSFDRTKINRERAGEALTVTSGQLAFELDHLRAKLASRDPAQHEILMRLARPRAHPLFHTIPGPVESWEKGSPNRCRCRLVQQG